MNNEIRLIIDGQKLKADYNDIYSGSVGVWTVRLIYAGFPEGLVTALRFRSDNGKEYYTAEINGNTAVIPHEVIEPPGFSIALAGYDMDGETVSRFYPTSSVYIRVGKNGFGAPADEELGENTQTSVFGYIITELRGIIDKLTAAVKSIADHRAAAVLDHPDASVTTEKLADGAATRRKLGADVTLELDQKADADDVYTKTESDVLLENKVDKVEGRGLSAISDIDYISPNGMSMLTILSQNSGAKYTLYLYNKEQADALLAQKVDMAEGRGLSAISDIDYISPDGMDILTFINQNGTGKYSVRLYNKEQADALLAEKASYRYVDNSINYLSGELEKKADKSDTLAGYGITDAYTKEEVDSKVSSVYRVCGSAPYDEVPPPEKAAVGDVYNMTADGVVEGGSAEAFISYTYISYAEELGSYMLSVTDAEELDKLFVGAALETLDAELAPVTCTVTAIIGNSVYIDKDLGMSENETGRFYSIQYPMVQVKAGDNVVWTKAGWDKLSASVDLSEYATKEELEKKADNDSVYTKEEADGILLNKADAETEEGTVVRTGTAVGRKTAAGGEIFNDYSERLTGELGNVLSGNVASGISSHAEGSMTTASGEAAHAEGNDNIASGAYSHAEGRVTIASELCSHAEGCGTIASGYDSHAENSETIASGTSAHAEGSMTTASGQAAHAEGQGICLNGDNYTYDRRTTASGLASHAEGYGSVSDGEACHAEGYGTIAKGKFQHVQGKFNIEDILDKNGNNNYAHIVGGGDIYNVEGEWKETRANIYTLDWSGNAWFAGDVENGAGDKLSQKADEAALKKLQYYGGADIEITDAKYFTYSDNGDGTCAVTGLTDDGKTAVTDMVIPYELGGLIVDRIGCDAFRDNKKLTNVVMPNTITLIDGYAFQSCSNLSKVILSDNLTAIQVFAFEDCAQLTSINIPENVTHIYEYAFYKCVALNNLILPSSISRIDYCVFGECMQLKSIDIPENVTTIGSFAFYGCSGLSSITIPDSVTYIDETLDAFEDCPNLTIICSQGSYADTYAKENGIPVKYDIIAPDTFTEKADFAALAEMAGDYVIEPVMQGLTEQLVFKRFLAAEKYQVFAGDTPLTDNAVSIDAPTVTAVQGFEGDGITIKLYTAGDTLLCTAKLNTKAIGNIKTGRLERC